MQNLFMANTYLNVTFKDKDAAKALGARWDAAQRQWYVPEGRELTPFAPWLPAGSGTELTTLGTALPLTATTSSANALAPLPKKGVSLSSLLDGVAQAVAQAYRSGVWTLVEVVELRANGGHVFLGVSERDSHGAVLAKTSAVIWQSTANLILPEFEQATGAQLAPGIKLLVRARPVFKPLHGFTLEIDAIDPEYTLGDLEARKREIRERLQSEGVFSSNKGLAAPWDYNNVLVLAPEGGAGLGDFQAEADRLQRHGICQFTYVFNRFQGEGAAREIADALQAALATWPNTQATALDAVVIIRGGGAVNDLAWLNDYDLARCICDSGIPVLTGIGHERDNTVLDEVAHTRFDTPSKVIAGIEQVIVKRTLEAKVQFEQITQRTQGNLQSVSSQVESLENQVRTQTERHLAQAKRFSSELLHGIRVDALMGVRVAAEDSKASLQLVKTQALTQLADAKRDVPLYWAQIAQGVVHANKSATVATETALNKVLEESRRDITRARTDTIASFDAMEEASKQHVRNAHRNTEILMREIAGQGPAKTLQRGFALVRDQNGKAITRATQTSSGSPIEIEFYDGKVQVALSNQA